MEDNSNPSEGSSLKMGVEETAAGQNGGGDVDVQTSRKRRCDNASNIEDIMSQITSKMGEMNTGLLPNDMVGAFMGVLGVDKNVAEFYLDSSSWDLEAAVSIYLENNEHEHRSHGFDTGTFAGASFTGGNPMHFQQRKRIRRKRYRSRKVDIVGLPKDWEALLSTTEGTVYFRHTPSGHSQFSVPPGFADADASEDNDDDSEKMNDAPSPLGTSSQDNDDASTVLRRSAEEENLKELK